MNDVQASVWSVFAEITCPRNDREKRGTMRPLDRGEKRTVLKIRTAIRIHFSQAKRWTGFRGEGCKRFLEEIKIKFYIQEAKACSKKKYDNRILCRIRKLILRTHKDSESNKFQQLSVAT